MSDDVTVTEQQDEIEDVVEDSTDESGFSDAFSDAIKGDLPVEKEDEKTPENEDAADKKEEENQDDKPEDKDDKKESTDDLSEEEKAADERGKEIIAEEEKAAKEAAEKAEAEKKPAAAEDEDIKPLTKDQVKVFLDMIPKSELPDGIEIDGVTYNVKDYMEDFPEVSIMSGIVTQKILERLVNNGVLITAEEHNKKIADIEDRMYGLHFDFSVLREMPDAMEIVESKEYKEWLEKSATKEDLALLGSINPKDYVLGLKKFKKVGSPASDKSKQEAAEKLKKKKDEHDAIHKSTMRAKPGKDSVVAAMEKGKSEYSSAFKEAQEKAEAEKKK